ncbi:hypothetical protein [Natrialba taiwanensis]|uniref:hypothetical protein n=1 Tax=Natrialba taiwanensis TaxID=160846 RepID=UPI0012679E87|nr:hypothetical protein [Natrialba taiwanensis]
MDTGNPHTRTGLGFIFVFALLVVLLIATRGVMGGVYEYVSNVNGVAGILFLILASIIPLWLVLRYVDSQDEE